MTTSPVRSRLPNRRRAETQEIVVGNLTLTATVGFAVDGRPAELFLAGAKDGSGMAAILEDASVVISVALQHGIPATALSKRIEDNYCDGHRILSRAAPFPSGEICFHSLGLLTEPTFPSA